MKLNRAIKILNDHYEIIFFNKNPELNTAMKLGIEALKFLDKIPLLPVRPGREPLPGETTE